MLIMKKGKSAGEEDGDSGKRISQSVSKSKTMADC